MPAWKVLFITAQFFVCLGLASATVVVPLTESAGAYRWQWFAGLLVATACMAALFALFLRRASRIMSQTPARSYERALRPGAGQVIRF